MKAGAIAPAFFNRPMMQNINNWPWKDSKDIPGKAQAKSGDESEE